MVDVQLVFQGFQNFEGNLFHCAEGLIIYCQRLFIATDSTNKKDQHFSPV